MIFNDIFGAWVAVFFTLAIFSFLYKNNPFYIQTKLDWRISGEPTEVKKSNSVSLQLASNDIPKIALYLPNLLQFHKK